MSAYKFGEHECYNLQIMHPSTLLYTELLGIAVHVVHFPYSQRHNNPVGCKITFTGTIQKDGKLYHPSLNLLKNFTLVVPRFNMIKKKKNCKRFKSQQGVSKS